MLAAPRSPGTLAKKWKVWLYQIRFIMRLSSKNNASGTELDTDTAPSP